MANSWEPWHFGYVRNPGTASVGFGTRGGEGRATAALQSFVPAQFAAPITHAASRWGVAATLLAAQLYAESNFNPFAVSGAGARGIAQFMPGTAATYGLRNAFDPAASIDAQAHLMHDLLAQFASVPLALAAYNAGPAPVSRCGCVPPIPETQAYVTRILGLLGGAGEATAGGLEGEAGVVADRRRLQRVPARARSPASPIRLTLERPPPPTRAPSARTRIRRLRVGGGTLREARHDPRHRAICRTRRTVRRQWGTAPTGLQSLRTSR